MKLLVIEDEKISRILHCTYLGKEQFICLKPRMIFARLWRKYI